MRHIVLAVREATTVIPFRRNPYVVKEFTDWHAATGHPLGRLVFFRTGSPPAIDAPHRAKLLSTRVSRTARRNQHPGAVAGLADDDQHSTHLLYTSRMLTTGGAVHADVAAQPRTEEEPFTFWADMHTTSDCAVATGPIPRKDSR